MRRLLLLLACLLLVTGCRTTSVPERNDPVVQLVPGAWLAPGMVFEPEPEPARPEPQPGRISSADFHHYLRWYPYWNPRQGATIERRWVGPTTGVGVDLAGSGWTALDSDAPRPDVLPEIGWQPVSLPAPASALAARYRWFRRSVQADDPGARLLTVGHIVGDDVLFVDGAAVDSTEGDGVSDQGRPRLYTIPTLAAGPHTLLLRVSGTGSTRTVGLVRAPLALSPAGWVRIDTLARWPIPPTDARAFFIDRWQREPPGWTPMLPSAGRFARMTDDGYLTLDLDPTGIELHPLPGSGRTRLELDADSVETVAVERLSWLAKTTRVRAWHDGVAQDVRWTGSLAYPGVRLQLAETDSVVRLRYRSETGLAPRFAAYEDDSFRVIIKPIEQLVGQSHRWLMIWSGTDSLEHPLLIMSADYRDRDRSFILNAVNGPSLTLTASGRARLYSNERQIGRQIVIATPFGIDGVSRQTLTEWARPGGLSDSLSSALSFRIHQIESIGKRFPAHSDLAYQVSGDSVRFRDIMRAFGDEDPRRYTVEDAPVPPLLALAWRDSLYPVRLDTTIHDRYFRLNGQAHYIGVPTRLGPYMHRVQGGVVTYTLPIPPMEATGLVRPTEGVDPELLRLLNESVSDVRSDGLRNALDLVYKSRASAYEAMPYLNAANRALLRAGEADVSGALDRRYWHDRTEPTTGLTYPWGYYIEGPRYELYDIDWGNGLPLYGLMVHARATGDWATIRRHWPEILRLNRYFQQFDDWGWLTASNADYGFGTGAGDCMGAGYLAAISTAIMARAVGDTAAYNEAASRSARAAVAVTMRFAIDRYAREHRLEKPGEFAIGYHETDGVLPIRADDYPWNYTSNISSNGVQPELFDLYMQTMPGRLRAYEDTLRAAHPHLFDGGYRYPTPTLYDGYSGYITLPHLYAQLRLGAPADSLRAWALTAARNRTLWWLAPVVLGGILSRDVPVIVRSWTPARYVDGSYDRATRRAVLTFESTEHQPIALVVQTPRPTTVAVNGRTVTGWDYDNDRLRLTLRPNGRNPITVTLNLPTP